MSGGSFKHGRSIYQSPSGGCFLFESVRLKTVILPCCLKDSDLMLQNLQWMRNLSGRVPANAVLHIDRAVNPKAIDQMLKVANQVFDDTAVSIYRSPRSLGWPNGPNIAFQNAIEFSYDNILGAWLWLEPDAIPVKPDWWQQLQREYDAASEPFMGCQVLGCPHMNGVAVYPSEVYSIAPSIASCTNKPWDTQMVDEIMGKFHNTKLIQHCGAVANGCCAGGGWPPPYFPSRQDVARLVNPESVIFHPSKDGSLIRMLSGRH